MAKIDFSEVKFVTLKPNGAFAETPYMGNENGEALVSDLRFRRSKAPTSFIIATYQGGALSITPECETHVNAIEAHKPETKPE